MVMFSKHGRYILICKYLCAHAQIPSSHAQIPSCLSYRDMDACAYVHTPYVVGCTVVQLNSTVTFVCVGVHSGAAEQYCYACVGVSVRYAEVHFTAVCFSPDGMYLSAGLSNGDIQVFNIRTFSRAFSLRRPQVRHRCLRVHNRRWSAILLLIDAFYMYVPLPQIGRNDLHVHVCIVCMVHVCGVWKPSHTQEAVML